MQAFVADRAIQHVIDDGGQRAVVGPGSLSGHLGGGLNHGLLDHSLRGAAGCEPSRGRDLGEAGVGAAVARLLRRWDGAG